MFKNKEYENFNDFIISRSNRIAAKKCFEIATMRHNKGSVLFVQGNSPCGKTHLLNTTAKIYKKTFSNDASVVSFRLMMDDYINAIKEKNIDCFYNKYLNNNLFLIDDIQCFVDMSSTQVEFVRIFKKFTDAGMKIILFSEYKLSRYNELMNGLNGEPYFSVVDIHKADLILRKKLLEKILYSEEVNISNKIFCFIIFNKKIEISSIKGCVSKIKLIKSLEDNTVNDKKIIKMLKEYER